MKKISYKNILKILFVYLIVYIPVALKRFPDIRNEIKYFAISDTIITSKQFFVFKYFSELYPDKPPLYFWLLSFFKSNFESYSFLTILFGSIVPSFIIAILLYNLFTKLKDEKFGFLVAISLVTIPFFIGTSVFLRMDMLMNLFITLSLYYFFSIYFNLIKNNFFNRAVIYLAMFLAVFTKGVAGVVVPISIILTYLFLEKNLSFLKKISFFYGMMFVVLAVGGWFLTVYLQSEGSKYLALMFNQETVGRIVKAKTHIKPFYYYFVRLSFLIFPYSIFWYCGIYKYLKDIKNYKNWSEVEKLGLIWSSVPLILFSLASGKLDIYMLPLFSGMVLLSLNFVEKLKKEDRYKKYMFIPIVVVIIFGGVVQATGIYNKYYTLKPIINEIEDSSKIYSYRFDDLRNIKGLGIDNEIINIGDEKELKNVLNQEKERSYIVMKSKYKDKVKDISNIKLKFINKAYCIFEK